MVEIMNTVVFKSSFEYYEKERLGKKPNTVRLIYDLDERFQMLESGEATHITIQSAERPREHFTRKITDYSRWGKIGIISWKHIEGGA